MKRLPSLVRRQVGWQLAAMAIAWFGLTFWLMVQMMTFGNGDLDRRTEFFAQALAEAGSAARNDSQDLERRLATTERIFIDGVITELDTTRNYVPVYPSPCWPIIWCSAPREIWRLSRRDGPTRRRPLSSMR
jgi:hypothetical protein